MRKIIAFGQVACCETGADAGPRSADRVRGGEKDGPFEVSSGSELRG